MAVLPLRNDGNYVVGCRPGIAIIHTRGGGVKELIRLILIIHPASTVKSECLQRLLKSPVVVASVDR